VFLRRLFSRRERWLDQPRTDYRQLGETREDPDDAVQAEYERQVTLVLRRWGVPDSCASVEVLRLGEIPDGRQAFVAIVRLFAWERKPSLRLLLGLPMLERKVRKAVRAHWVSEVSHFGGVWLHASERLVHSGADVDLRHLLASLTHPRRSGWSELRGASSGPDSLR